MEYGNNARQYAEKNGGLVKICKSDRSLIARILKSAKGGRTWEQFSRDVRCPGSEELALSAAKGKGLSIELCFAVIDAKAKSCPYTSDMLLAANGYVWYHPLDEMLESMRPLPTDRRDFRYKKYYPGYVDTEGLEQDREFDPNDRASYQADLEFLCGKFPLTSMQRAILEDEYYEIFRNKMIVLCLRRFAYYSTKNHGTKEKRDAEIAKAYLCVIKKEMKTFLEEGDDEE